MSEMPLRQPGFTYCACGPFTKNKKRIQKFTETGDSRYKGMTITNAFQKIVKESNRNKTKYGTITAAIL